VIDGPGGNGADELTPPFLRVDLDVDEALDLRHHLLVRLLVALHHPVVESLFFHPDVHVLDVPIEELHVLLVVHQAARHVELVLRRLEEAGEGTS